MIRIDGPFDASASARLAGWLRELPAHEPLVLEFGRECLDAGLAAVAGHLAGRASLVVRGLSLHQQKILRYLGVELDRSPPRLAAG